MNEDFFKLAIKEAEKAFGKDEVPVGAVVVLNGKVIASAHNLRETKQNVLTHAELLAISKACKKLGSWRLEDCELYVTLEPCPMCAGAISQSRIKKVYYGAKDPKGGVVSLGISIHDHKKLNHRFEMIFYAVERCGKILSEFFKMKRKNSKSS